MATVSVLQSPQVLGTMASRRAPLSNLPNATNSPYRAAAAPFKRSRSHSNATQDAVYGQPPPLKKKIVEVQQTVPATPKKTARERELAHLGKLLGLGGGQRLAVPGKARQPQKPAVDESLDTLRQWQQHYRKAFPSYVFYFESVPEEFRRKCSRGIASLGAVSYPTHWVMCYH